MAPGALEEDVGVTADNFCENISSAQKLQKLILCLCLRGQISPCLEVLEPLT